MNKINYLGLLIGLMIGHINTHAQLQISYQSLKGVWSYFHITPDSFAPDRMIATEQRLFFLDNDNVVLSIHAKEGEYRQETVYNLKYSLALKDNVPYITFFAPGSKQVLGGYVRMPYFGSIEMALDPNFTKQRQLFQQQDFVKEDNKKTPSE